MSTGCCLAKFVRKIEKLIKSCESNMAKSKVRDLLRHKHNPKEKKVLSAENTSVLSWFYDVIL